MATVTTVRKLVTQSLRILNVISNNQVPNADDTTVCVDSMNAMIDSWSNESLMIYSIDSFNFALQGGKQTYTLGVGGDWDPGARPIQIREVYFLQQANVVLTPPVAPSTITTAVITTNANTLSIPMSNMTDAQWAAIPLKQLSTAIPTAIYDDGAFPLRNISVYPVPTQTLAVTLWLRQPLLTYVTLDDPINLPPGYEQALTHNLAIYIAAIFGKTIPQQVEAIAIKSLADIKSTNTRAQYTKYDPALLGNSRYNTFDWRSGQVVPWR